MTTHTAEIAWTLRRGEDFAHGRYGRTHVLRFDGGAELSASASPSIVGPWADASAVDPEEMLVAALSSCHMLTFLHVARLAGFGIASYRDRAEGVMEEIAGARRAVTRVTLRPVLSWIGDPPTPGQMSRMHEEAHAQCFVANSVRCEVVIASPC